MQKKKQMPKRNSKPKTKSTKSKPSNPIGRQRSKGIASSTVVRNSSRITRESIVVSHSEYVDAVQQSTVFRNRQFRINPGLDELFPWLAPIAMRYEMYRFKSLSFEYVNSCASTATGKCVLAVDFDSEDSAPTDPRVINQYAGATGSNFHENFTMVIEAAILADRQKNNLYVRNGTYPGTDSRTYDLGTLNVATYGGTDGQTGGELWIHYTVELMIPQMSDTTESLSIPSHSVSNGGNVPSYPGKIALQSAASVLNATLAGAAPSSVSNTLIKGIADIGIKAMTSTSFGVGAPEAGNAFKFDHDWEGYIIAFCTAHLSLPPTAITTLTSWVPYSWGAKDNYQLATTELVESQLNCAMTNWGRFIPDPNSTAKILEVHSNCTCPVATDDNPSSLVSVATVSRTLFGSTRRCLQLTVQSSAGNWAQYQVECTTICRVSAQAGDTLMFIYDTDTTEMLASPNWEHYMKTTYVQSIPYPMYNQDIFDVNFLPLFASGGKEYLPLEYDSDAFLSSLTKPMRNFGSAPALDIIHKDKLLCPCGSKSTV